LIEGEDDSTQEKVPTSPSDSATGVVEKGKPDRGAWLIMASLLLVPLLAFSLYQMLGASDDVDIAELLQRHSSASISTEDYASIGKKIQRKISRRLESKPGDVFYRVTLARLQMEDNNFLAAKKSYEQALTWSPDNAELMAEYAQVLYFVADSKFEGESGAVLDKALSMDPNNRTALGLQGIRAFGDENYALAIKSWQTALRAINPASQQAQALQSGILRAKKLLGDNVSDNNASGEKLPSLLIKVSLSQELKASPDQSVYVFAREWQGKPMPLAVVKLSVADLPASVILDDSMAMPGGESLSSASSIQVVARVSSTGSAIPSEGDYEGLTGKVAASALSDGKTQEIPVLIDRKL
jgi:cytochrome c-type biogenesis protein CcmH